MHKKTRLANLHDKVLSDCDVTDPVVVSRIVCCNILYISFSMGAG